MAKNKKLQDGANWNRANIAYTVYIMPKNSQVYHDAICSGMRPKSYITEPPNWTSSQNKGILLGLNAISMHFVKMIILVLLATMIEAKPATQQKTVRANKARMAFKQRINALRRQKRANYGKLFY